MIEEFKFDLDKSYCVKFGDKTNKKMALRQALTLAVNDGCLKNEKFSTNYKSPLYCSIKSGRWIFYVDGGEELGDTITCMVDVMTKEVTTGKRTLDAGYKLPN